MRSTIPDKIKAALAKEGALPLDSQQLEVVSQWLDRYCAALVGKECPMVDGGLPLVIWLRNEADRQEFIEAFKQIHPYATTHPLP